MSVTEAEEFFGAGEARPPAAHTILDRLAHVGARGGDCHGRLGLSGVRTPAPGPHVSVLAGSHDGELRPGWMFGRAHFGVMVAPTLASAGGTVAAGGRTDPTAC